MKILFVGDSHCDINYMRSVIDFAVGHNLDTIVQVGDFGYWPRHSNGAEFLKFVAEYSQLNAINVHWIAGNHEDWDMIDENMNPAAFTWHDNGLIHIGSGAVWEWDGLRFGSLGGAYSIDRTNRTKFQTWFPQEMPDSELITGLGKVDVLITHDAPIVPPVMYGDIFKRDAESQRSQRVIYDALLSTKPSLLVHGHWHCNDQYGVAGTTVQGLGCNMDGMSPSVAVYDTATRQMYSFTQVLYGALDNETE